MLLAFAYLVFKPITAKVAAKDSFLPEKKPHRKIENYPQGDFRNPLDIPLQLVANFGELRPNHYHMGLDIRTMQRENLPVYAAADGYVRKVKIEKSGFGNAIYIEHYNGFTTVYAHLNSFFPALAAYVKEQQYKSKSWEQEMDIDPELFVVKKGQFIAFSGNTGGSQGPHLHFEIRNTETGNNLNPLLFGFGIADRTPPSIYKLVYYNRNQSTYEGSPTNIPIGFSKGKYNATSSVVQLNSSKISFGISADDMITNMHGHVGIYSTDIWVDDVKQGGFVLNDISYDETRYINAAVDYKMRMKGASYIQHISRLPGNTGSFFADAYDGVITLKDTTVHRIAIIVKDVAGNTSTLLMNCKWNGKANYESSDKIQLMPPGKANHFKANDCKVYFSPNAFYDTLPFYHNTVAASHPKAVSLLHQIADFSLPVHDSFTVQIQPSQLLPENLKQRVVVHLQSNKRTEVEKGIWVNGMVQAKFKYFGNIMLLLDTIAPAITPWGWANGANFSGKNTLALKVKDDVEDVNNFRALVDGEWILFGRKGDYFIHTFDDKIKPGKHILKVLVEDEAGNTGEKTFTFVR